MITVLFIWNVILTIVIGIFIGEFKITVNEMDEHMDSLYEDSHSFIRYVLSYVIKVEDKLDNEIEDRKDAIPAIQDRGEDLSDLV